MSDDERDLLLNNELELNDYQDTAHCILDEIKKLIETIENEVLNYKIFY